MFEDDDITLDEEEELFFDDIPDTDVASNNDDIVLNGYKEIDLSQKESLIDNDIDDESLIDEPSNNTNYPDYSEDIKSCMKSKPSTITSTYNLKEIPYPNIEISNVTSLELTFLKSKFSSSGIPVLVKSKDIFVQIGYFPKLTLDIIYSLSTFATRDIMLNLSNNEYKSIEEIIPCLLLKS